MPKPKLEVGENLWWSLIAELQQKGAGQRETGAFLLGTHQNAVVTEFITYDVLDPEAFDSGIIEFRGSGYVKLWDICNSKGLRVWSDVHTHPFQRTNQSSLDKRHPMISQSGHIAFIVPNYAAGLVSPLDGVGVYEYQGCYEWKKRRTSQILIV